VRLDAEPSFRESKEWKMELRRANSIVKTLAEGVHPITGEVFAADCPYNEPQIIRALFTIHEFIRQAKKPRMTADERRRENLEYGRPRNAGLPWSEEDRAAVASGFEEGKQFGELAVALERSSGAIRAELIRQGLVPPDYQ